MKTFENLHVLLLKGGEGSEREVSLNTAIECARTIKEIGCKITEVDIAESNISSLLFFVLAKRDIHFRKSRKQFSTTSR